MWKQFFAVVILPVALSLVVLSPAPRPHRSDIGLGPQHPAQMPQGLRQAFEDATYSVEPDGGGYRASNPNQKLDLRFEAASASVRVNEAEVTFRQSSWGREGLPAEVVTPNVSVQGNRLEIQRGAITEWYVNDRLGLEQGFTVAERPRGDGSLAVVLAVSGDLRPRLDSPASLALESGGAAVLRYAGLKSWDARGRALASRMEVRGHEVRLVVDDSGAIYPVTIDPWLVQAKLTASDGIVGDQFGMSVALSGNTAVVGARYQNGWIGAAYVFVRNGTSWTQQAKLTASDGTPLDYFGQSVAVSGDTAVVGAWGKDGDTGVAYVFVRNGTAWTQQAKLTASDRQGGDYFGYSVAVSGDTAVAGAEWEYASSGAVYVFVRSGSSWAEQAKFTVTRAGNEYLGDSVAVDGDTVLAGAHGDYAWTGAAYVFVRNGTVWTEQAKLTASDGAANDVAGISVALDADTAQVGAPGNNGATGAAYIFLRNGTNWTQQAKLTASGGVAGDQFGASAALSGDRAVAGAPFDDNLGSAYVFVRSGTTWTQQAKLTATDSIPGSQFGHSAAAGANTTVIGSLAGTGSAYVFTVPCTLSLNLGYVPNTLSIGYTLGTSQPGSWAGYLVTASGVRRVWNRSVRGGIDPPVSGTIAIPNFSPAGNVGVLSTDSTNAGLACWDFEVVNTGGAGPTVEQLRRIAEKNGLRLP